MGKTKKKRPVWTFFAKGLAVSAAVYLGGHLLLAELAVRGIVGEEGAFSVTAVLCVVSALLGGMCVVHRCPWGPLPGGLLAALLFGMLLVAAGLLGWRALTWTGRGGALLVCALAGGGAAGALGARRPRPKRRTAL